MLKRFNVLRLSYSHPATSAQVAHFDPLTVRGSGVRLQSAPVSSSVWKRESIPTGAGREGSARKWHVCMIKPFNPQVIFCPAAGIPEGLLFPDLVRKKKEKKKRKKRRKKNRKECHLGVGVCFCQCSHVVYIYICFCLLLVCFCFCCCCCLFECV